MNEPLLGKNKPIDEPFPVIAFDLGSNTGWAWRGRGSTMQEFIFSGVQKFPLLRGDSMGMRFLRFKGWVEEMLARTNARIVAYEAAIGFHKSLYAGQLAHGFEGILQCIIADRNLECLNVTPSELKRDATGKGNANKEAMIAAAQILYPKSKIDNDNQADALLILNFAEKTLRGRQ